MSEWPKTMTHPNYVKGKVTEIRGVDANSGRPFVDYQGEPDMFPPVYVKNPDEEASCRARGYFLAGETPPPPPEWAEYPVMLVHPKHVDAIEPQHIPVKTDAGISITIIPGTPEVLPPRQANSAEEERALEEKGYKRTGIADPDAVRTAHASPNAAGRKVQKYPMMGKDGKIIDPHAQTSGRQEYPKWIGDKIVNNPVEEEALTGERIPGAHPSEFCVICGDEIMDDDPAGEGPKGKYHLAHMAEPPKALEIDVAVGSKSVQDPRVEVRWSKDRGAEVKDAMTEAGMDPDAPFGRKKDGSPKKRPGRAKAD